MTEIPCMFEPVQTKRLISATEVHYVHSKANHLDDNASKSQLLIFNRNISAEKAPESSI